MARKGRVEVLKVGQLWKSNERSGWGGGTIKRVVKIDGREATLLSEFGRMTRVNIDKFLARQNHQNGYTCVGEAGMAWPG